MELSAEALLARAGELVEPLRARAAETESLRHVPRSSVEAIVDAGLMRIATPKLFGGLDVPYATMLEAAVVLGTGCGSTGWCYALWAVDSWLAGLFPLEAQEEIFASGPDVLISGTYNPMGGRLDPIPGGYRFNGHWEFASGSEWCEWVFLGARGPGDEIMWAALPRSDFQVVDTWQVLGLRGTSSNDIVVQDLFVPEHRTLRVADIVDGGDARPWQIHHQARYWLPFRNMDPLQRMYRDATAVAHRDRLVLDYGGENFARLRLGLEPTPRLF